MLYCEATSSSRQPGHRKGDRPAGSAARGQFTYDLIVHISSFPGLESMPIPVTGGVALSQQESAGLTALGAVLSPLEGSGPKTEAVVQRLSAAISLGVMVDGQQLPSETDLADQLGVSTMTLREALAVLRQQGIVRTKRGRGGGSFICDLKSEI